MPATPKKIQITAQDLARARGILVAEPYFEDTDTYLEAFTLDQLRHLPEPEWLVESLIEKNGFSALTGQPGVGKTFMALDWALSLSHGLPTWAGFKMPGERTKVIYFLLEGFGWAWKRVDAWLEARGVAEMDTEHMLMIQQHVSIWPGESEKDKDRLKTMQQIRNTVEAFQPELVVFDTYARSTTGMNENSATETGKVVRFVDELRLDYGTAVLLLHHPTKAGQSFRGSNAGPGAADVVVHLTEREKDDLVILEWEKIKNGGHPEPQSFAKIQAADAIYLDPQGIVQSTPFYEELDWLSSVWGPGVFTPKDFGAALYPTYSDPGAQANKVLKQMQDKGMVTKVGHGKWQAAADPAELAEEVEEL